MITVSDFIVTILPCITLLPLLKAEVIAGVFAAARLAALGVILPSTVGFASRFFEKHFDAGIGIQRVSKMGGMGSLALASWLLLKTATMDARCSCVLLSFYAYKSGRFHFPDAWYDARIEAANRFAQSQSLRDLRRFYPQMPPK